VAIPLSRNNDTPFIKGCFLLTFVFYAIVDALDTYQHTSLDGLDARKHNLLTKCVFVTDYYLKNTTHLACRPAECNQKFLQWVVKRRGKIFSGSSTSRMLVYVLKSWDEELDKLPVFPWRTLMKGPQHSDLQIIHDQRTAIFAKNAKNPPAFDEKKILSSINIFWMSLKMVNYLIIINGQYSSRYM
jgi:hypothetical protein